MLFINLNWTKKDFYSESLACRTGGLERDHLRVKKIRSWVTPLFILYHPLEIIGMKEWEREQNNSIDWAMSQVTNVQMYTAVSRKVVQKKHKSVRNNAERHYG